MLGGVATTIIIHVDRFTISVVDVDVQFTYPPTYPDVVPGISIVSHDGVSEQQMNELELHLVTVVSD